MSLTVAGGMAHHKSSRNPHFWVRILFENILFFDAHFILNQF